MKHVLKTLAKSVLIPLKLLPYSSSLKETGLLINSASKTVKNGAKNKTVDYLVCY